MTLSRRTFLASAAVIPVAIAAPTIKPRPSKPSEMVRSGWARTNYIAAYDKDDQYVSVNSDEAVSWSLPGALCAHVSPQESARRMLRFRQAAIAADPSDHSYPELWENHPYRTKHEVADLLESIGL